MTSNFKTSFIIALILSSSIAQAAKLPPLILQGKLLNCPDKFLFLYSYDSNFQQNTDTIIVKDNGSFYLKTTRVEIPQRAVIRGTNVQIANLYLAPGFQLILNGDAKEFKTLQRTLQISGIGSKANQYKLELAQQSLKQAKEPDWHKLDSTDFKKWLLKSRHTNDSIYQKVFAKDRSEPYFADFKKMVANDLRFTELYYWYAHLDDNRKYTLVEQNAFLKNIPEKWLKNLSNDDYVLSEDYKAWFQSNYINYLRAHDRLIDSNKVKVKGYMLNLINETFSGKSKDYMIYRTMNFSISQSASLDELEKKKANIESYISSLNSPELKEILTKKYKDKHYQLTILAKGMPGYEFSLKNNDSKTFTLSDFRGKVVYIDLWASWCGPCRAETPFLAKIAEKYHSNDQLQIIGIAVSDKTTDWQRALVEEKTQWLQLHDAENKVRDAYQAFSIPRYILIDKKGNIVTSDAPRPSDTKKLIPLLDEELAKSN